MPWQLDLNSADLRRSVQNLKFGVRELPNPDRDFFRKFLAVSKNIGSFFGFFHMEKPSMQKKKKKKECSISI